MKYDKIKIRNHTYKHHHSFPQVLVFQMHQPLLVLLSVLKRYNFDTI
jgi:hypothetical protein